MTDTPPPLPPRPRARALGVPFKGETGPYNAITDVAGVEVGHCTLVFGEGPLRAQPLLEPDALTLGAFVGLVAVTLLVSGSIGWDAHKRASLVAAVSSGSRVQAHKFKEAP